MTSSILQYNICFSRRAVGEFSKYNWNNRKDEILEIIIKKNASIVCLQEVHESYIDHIESNLNAEMPHYRFVKAPYLKKEGVNIYLMIIYDNIKFQLLRSNIHQLSAINDKCLDYLSIKLRDSMSSKLLEVSCVHVPMSLEARLTTMRLIAENVNDSKIENVIVTGDFNAFPDELGYEQIILFKQKAKLIDATQFLYNTAGERVEKTFDPYPYDKFEKKTENQNKLDYIFTKGKIETLNPLTEMTRASDHYPVSLEFCFETE